MMRRNMRAQPVPRSGKAATLPATPADALAMAQAQMLALLTGQLPARVETPQLGAVQFVQTTPADLQRAIDYLQQLVDAGNTWDALTNGSMQTGSTGRKPISIFGWP
jgi:hypothetical protein